MLEQQMWNEYIRINPNVKYYEAWSFGGNTPEMPNILANLVLKGIKTATSSAYPSYIEENSALPPVGGYNIILNTDKEAVCITETTKVYIIPFSQVTEEHAYKEGEFDRTLSSWQEFTKDMLVVCEEFEVVYPPK